MKIKFYNCPKTNDMLNKDLDGFFQELNLSTPQTKYLKVLHLKNHIELFGSLVPIAEKIRHTFRNVILVGMGGAINNPLSITNLRKFTPPNIIPLNTTDSIYVNNLLNSLNLEETACIVISNTGATIETNALAGVVYNKFAEAGHLPSNHFTFIVNNGDNPLSNFARSINATLVPHEEDIGGRFSFFGATAYLPALIKGLDVKALLEGANEVIKDLWEKKADSSPALSAKNIFLASKPLNVGMSYCEDLAALLELYVQLIAESLGKDGKGLTPLKALGPLDQHSMLQLFLDGPKDKFYTLIHTETFEDSCTIPKLLPHELIRSKKLGLIHHSMYKATLNSLTGTSCPLRTITLQALDEYNLGRLLMHFYAEVIILGALMKVNPFDQPSIEQIKLSAKSYISSY